MGAVLIELFLNTAVPAFAFAALVLVRRYVAPRMIVADAIGFALCFAAGQRGILGELPWPPMETTHALLFLVAVSPLREAAAPRESRWPSLVGTFAVLNIGLYYALYPLFETEAVSVVIQVVLGNALAAVSFRALDSIPERLRPMPLIVSAGMLGPILLLNGSTSLAMTAFLLSGLCAVSWVATGFSLKRSIDLRLVGVSTPVLLLSELYNYVL
ncbi:MAG: hypothetical protein AAFQ77_01615 [Myxococcota bacterium]